MSLPRPPLATDVVVVGDEKVEVRSLSRSEATRLRSLGDDYEAAESWIVACGTGVTPEEAAAWRDEIDPASAGVVVDRIMQLSGLAEEASKSDGQSADPPGT